jgi:gliding motility-associated-like protein
MDIQCSVQDSVTITVTPLPQITISEDITIIAGESAVLTASGGDTYLWQPAASLNVPDAPSVIATPLVTTVYMVDVSENQCRAQASVTVTVLQKECPDPVIPSAFTPNGDNKNDQFGIINSFNYVSAEIQVFNRWGERVFRSVNFEKWDGFYKGDLQPISTFVYSVTATCPDQKTVSSKGSVSLIR